MENIDEKKVASPIDMAALASFNKKLASEALAQLYADGHKALALEWAGRLDPFATATLRQSIPCVGWSHESHSFSLFQLLLNVGDLDGVDLLARQAEEGSRSLYSRCDTLIDSICRHLSAEPSSAFAEAIFERLDPEELSESEKSSYGSCGSHGEKWGKLASAAGGAGRHKWFGRIAKLADVAAKTELGGGELLKDCCKPASFSADMARAIIEHAKVERGSLVWVCQEWVASDNAQAQEFGLEKMAELIAEEPKKDLESWEASREARSRAAWILFRASEKTPPAWLALHCSTWVDPFDGLAGSGSIAVQLLGGEIANVHSANKEAARARRVGHEDLMLPLLSAMVSCGKGSAESLSARFELSCVHGTVQKYFVNTRKLDLLSLCVAKGMYRCANLLVESGADWRFAAKQCGNGLRPAYSSDEPDMAAAAGAYFDALSLRSVSLRGMAKRDAKAEKSGDKAPAVSGRSMRL